MIRVANKTKESWSERRKKLLQNSRAVHDLSANISQEPTATERTNKSLNKERMNKERMDKERKRA